VTVLEIIQRGTDFLARKGVDSPRLQVELLLAHVLQLPRLKLYLNFERRLTKTELDPIRELLKRRGSREPLQQILGTTSFCGYEITLTKDVLVPRPETEVLAEKAWAFLQNRVSRTLVAPRVLDFGTGSGCIAVALACQVPDAMMTALDISAAALEVARQNAARHNLGERFQFVQSDGFSALGGGRQFDLIVSNPPYIPSDEIDTLAPEVRNHEPRLALDGGTDGLAFIRQLASQAPVYLAREGRLMLELGDGQGGASEELFHARGWQTEPILPDLSGRPRILVACRRES
jgi:release factor glutamine methyltransferase